MQHIFNDHFLQSMRLLPFYFGVTPSGLLRIIACLCLARLDNSSHQVVGVTATVCEYRFISRSSSLRRTVRAEGDYLQSSQHNILPGLILSNALLLPLSFFRSFAEILYHRAVRRRDISVHIAVSKIIKIKLKIQF